ncbi:uncharacterized protein LOC143223895 [Tachypleus tridentatus]|uniref:uncharacterized protein LOC143223895 n=1 Tax=Tachypleus tridentatus TaxID=6853 RepID=UPI003FD4D7D9
MKLQDQAPCSPLLNLKLSVSYLTKIKEILLALSDKKDSFLKHAGATEHEIKERIRYNWPAFYLNSRSSFYDISVRNYFYENFSFIVTATCDDIIKENATVFRNPEFPQGHTESGSCQVSVAVKPGICQLRLDFFHFSLAPPARFGPFRGKCVHDTFTVSTGIGELSFPTLCGENSDQHVFVDTSQADEAFISFHFGKQDFSRKWAIQVLQIPCQAPEAAPPGCLQYYTGATNVIKSFNFNENPSGVHFLNNIFYSICIRRELGRCSITYQAEGRNGFNIGPGHKARVGSQCCRQAYLFIPTGSVGSRALGNIGDRFCGRGLSRTGFVTAKISPFLLAFVSSDLLVGEGGVGPLRYGVYDRYVSGRNLKDFPTNNNRSGNPIELERQTKARAMAWENQHYTDFDYSAEESFENADEDLAYSLLEKQLSLVDNHTTLNELIESRVNVFVNDFTDDQNGIESYDYNYFLHEEDSTRYYNDFDYYNTEGETVDYYDDYLDEEDPDSQITELQIEDESLLLLYDKADEKFECLGSCSSACDGKCEEDCEGEKTDDKCNNCRIICDSQMSDKLGRCDRFCRRLPNGFRRGLCRRNCKRHCWRECPSICNPKKNFGCDCDCEAKQSNPCKRICRLNLIRRRWRASGFQLRYTQNPC